DVKKSLGLKLNCLVHSHVNASMSMPRSGSGTDAMPIRGLWNSAGSKPMARSRPNRNYFGLYAVLQNNAHFKGRFFHIPGHLEKY
ncbi:MAG: hypothetical protein ACRD4O_16890, partial [Bryobacteraceae bacterium]